MNFLQESRTRALANSYVLGVMPRRTRQRFARALSKQPELREEVLMADAALQKLSVDLPDLTPSPKVWQIIAGELDKNNQKNTSKPWGLVVIFALIGVAVGLAIARAGIF